jgi:N-methylhydantoinase A
VLDALDTAGVPARDIDLLVLGTTVGTNALLERRGARVAYLTTEGFEDVPFIQRGNRPFHYDLHWQKPRPFIDRSDSFGVRERIDYAGRTHVPLDEEQLADVIDQIGALAVEAVAVNLLFSYVNPEHERRVAARLRERLPGLAVSLSHEVAPVWREYERGLTTIADAYLKPLLSRFVDALERGLASRAFRGRTSLLKSNGGLQPAREAARRPVELCLSGLAGGIVGGCRFVPAGESLITLDMGGTSCDIAVVEAGRVRTGRTYEVEFGLPLTVPAIDVAAIGAGGGSIARLDDGGFLRVGPASAGADPGPAAYGRGGTAPTVTDANLVLGRLDPEYFLGGRMPLSPLAAEQALARLGRALGLSVDQTALAVVEVANETMAGAIRLRTVEVGIDPRSFALAAFGGAGPLHACEIARWLGIRRVLVPPHPGLCSAWGAATAELRSDRLATVYFRSDSARAADVQAALAPLIAAVRTELAREGTAREPEVTIGFGLRYLGQNYEHAVELAEQEIDDAALRSIFTRHEALHDELYGYHLGAQVVELVELTATARAGSTAWVPVPSSPDGAPATRRPVRFHGGAVEATVIRRGALAVGATLAGPAVVQELDSTTLLGPQDRLLVLDSGTLSIDVDGGEHRRGAK